MATLGRMIDVRRAETPRDKAISLDVYNRVEPEETVTPEEVAAWERANEASAEWVAALDGEDVGSGACAIQPQRPAAILAMVHVLPAARRRGAGSALYAAVSAFARAHGRGLLETRIAQADEASIAFAERRGFVEHQRDDWLELDLAMQTPSFPPPDGVEIVTLAQRPELVAGMYDAACEGFPDIPGEEDWTAPPREDWLQRVLTDNPPEASFVAVAGDEVVGWARVRPRGDHGLHAMTTVKRSWRGRGIARALKSAQIDWARAQGMTFLRTANEQRNAPMLAVNLALGYVPRPGRVTMRGPAL